MDFSLGRWFNDPLDIAFYVTKGIESPTYAGNGINEMFFFIYIPILVVALSAILVLFTCLILSSVLGFIAVIHLITDQHIVLF